MKPPHVRGVIAGVISAVLGSTLLVYACARDNPVEPDATGRPPSGPELEQTGVIGSFTIPTPATNEETLDWTSSGIVVDSGVAVRVTVTGFLTATANPVRVERYGPPTPLVGGNQAGPAGWIGLGGGFNVGVRILTPDSVGIDALLGPVEQTAETITGIRQGPGTIEVSRMPQIGGSAGCVSTPPPGQPCGCPEGLCMDSQHDWDMSGTQTLTVEALPPPEVTVTPERAEVVQDTVVFEVTLPWAESFFVTPAEDWTWHTVDGQPGASRRLAEAGDCGTATTCTFLIFEPGFMTVGVGTTGASFVVESPVVEIGPECPVGGQGALLGLTAEESCPGEQELVVTCTPASPVRGETVTCTASLALPQEFVVTRRWATGLGIHVSDEPMVSHGAGEIHEWSGPVVGSSDVVIEVQISDTTGSSTLTNDPPAHFEVQPRNWPAWVLAPQLPEGLGWRRMVPYPVRGDAIGVSVLDSPVFGTLPVLVPSTGPNQGVAYLRDPVIVDTWLIGLHPALFPHGLAPTDPAYQVWHLWYDDQNGIPGGTCGPMDVAQLLANARRHEGSTGTPDSHFGVASTVLAQLQPWKDFEAEYYQGSAAELRRLAAFRFEVLVNYGQYRAAQDQFDMQDLVRANTENIPCNANQNGFDFNPFDP